MTIREPFTTTPADGLLASDGITPIGNTPGPRMQLDVENNLDGPMVTVGAPVSTIAFWPLVV